VRRRIEGQPHGQFEAFRMDSKRLAEPVESLCMEGHAVGIPDFHQRTEPHFGFTFDTQFEMQPGKAQQRRLDTSGE
jgi:hypothetical protein